MNCTWGKRGRFWLLAGSMIAGVVVVLGIVACQFYGVYYFDGTHVVIVVNSTISVHLWACPYTRQFCTDTKVLRVEEGRPDSLREALGLIRPFFEGANGPDDEWFLILPLWTILIATTVYPLYWILRYRRTRPGQCHYCGYNLTGNISGICPECGKPVTRGASTGSRVR